MHLAVYVGMCCVSQADLGTSRPTTSFSGIQFTKYFMKFVFVDLNKLVVRNPNVILIAHMRPALEHGCGIQIPNLDTLFLHKNFLYVPFIEMQMRVRSRSVHNFGTGKRNVGAKWRLSKNFQVKRGFESEVATAQPHWFCKSRRCTQTYILLFPTLCY